MESLFHQLAGSTFLFVKNTHQKAANFTLCLILPVGMAPWWFHGGQCILHCSAMISISAVGCGLGDLHCQSPEPEKYCKISGMTEILQKLVYLLFGIKSVPPYSCLCI